MEKKEIRQMKKPVPMNVQSVGKLQHPLFGFCSERGAVLLASRHRMRLESFASQVSAESMKYAG
jgi:hypothetical protein